jgi:Glycosyltransferase 61
MSCAQVSVLAFAGIFSVWLPSSWRSWLWPGHVKLCSPSLNGMSSFVVMCQLASSSNITYGATTINDSRNGAVLSSRAEVSSHSRLLRTRAAALRKFEINLQAKVLTDVCMDISRFHKPVLVMVGSVEHLVELNRSVDFVNFGFQNGPQNATITLLKPMAYEVVATEHAPDHFTWVPGTSLHVIPTKNINHNLYDRVLPALSYALSSRTHSVDRSEISRVRPFIVASKRFRQYPRSTWCQWGPVFRLLSHSVVALFESEIPVCFERVVLSWRSEMRAITSLKSLPETVALDAMSYYRETMSNAFTRELQPVSGRVNILVYSRSDAARKILVNAKKLVQRLRDRYARFNITHLDEIPDHLPSVAPFSVQVQDFAMADMIVSPHGAWTAHAAVMKRGGVLMELCEPYTWFWPALRDMIQGTLVPVRNCTRAGPANVGTMVYFVNLTVDLTAFEEAFEGVVKDKGW